MHLSSRVANIKPSPTLSVSKRATELKAQGKPIIDLSLGEPDFDTPESIKQAAILALKQGFTKYTAVEGILPLRQAIVEKFAADNHLNYTPHQILVSTGAKQCLINLMLALLNPEDEMILPAPYWVSYPDMASLAGAKTVVIRTEIEQQFKITASQLKAAITPKTRLVVLNSPSNPTGMAYSKAEMKSIGEVLLRNPDIMIVTDDIYEKIYWKSEPFSNILMACPGLSDRTVIVHGVSKTYAMTGWRIGFAAGPAPLISAMGTIQSQSTSGPCSISQKAALEALTGPQDCVEKMVQTFKERHDYVVGALNKMPGVRCLEGDGTFYAFPSVKEVLARAPQFKSDSLLAEYLLMEANVACVPGEAFGAPGYLRFSFATSMELLNQALDQMASALKRLG